MAEWLGKGLQNLVQRFESASDLVEEAVVTNYDGFFVSGGHVFAPAAEFGRNAVQTAAPNWYAKCCSVKRCPDREQTA